MAGWHRSSRRAGNEVSLGACSQRDGFWGQWVPWAADPLGPMLGCRWPWVAPEADIAGQHMASIPLQLCLL